MVERLKGCSAYFEEVLRLNREINIEMGKEGGIESPESAFCSLFLGDESGLSSDRAEVDELIEEVNKLPGDPVAMVMEGADVVYHMAKLPENESSGNYLRGLVKVVGLKHVEDLLEATRVKFQARLDAVKMGLDDEERQAFERSMIERFMLGVERDNIEREKATLILNAIREDYAYLVGE